MKTLTGNPRFAGKEGGATMVTKRLYVCKEKWSETVLSEIRTGPPWDFRSLLRLPGEYLAVIQHQHKIISADSYLLAVHCS